MVFIESQNNLSWKKPWELSGPTSCSQKSQLRESDQFAQDFTQSGLGQGLHNPSQQPAPVLTVFMGRTNQLTSPVRRVKIQPNTHSVALWVYYSTVKQLLRSHCQYAAHPGNLATTLFLTDQLFLLQGHDSHQKNPPQLKKRSWICPENSHSKPSAILLQQHMVLPLGCFRSSYKVASLSPQPLP